MKSIRFNTNSAKVGSRVCLKARRKQRISRAFWGFSGVLLVATVIVSNLGHSHAQTANTSFNVNVKDTLTVSITLPDEWASGSVNSFLRNKINLEVASNNANGFTASMFSQSTTDLVNNIASTATIPTLASSSTRGNFPTNYWGYSLGSGTISSSLNSNTYGETDAGNDDSNYYPLVSTSATPITILTGTGSGTQDIFFGAKADATKLAGTYTNTVVISVVTDTINPSTNPITPTNPATPNATPNVATYTPSPVDATTYTYVTHDTSSTPNTTTTTTQVSDGDNTSAYSGYTPPQGASEYSSNNISGNSTLATSLAVAATAAAATGGLFFVLAKRHKDDDEEEQ